MKHPSVILIIISTVLTAAPISPLEGKKQAPPANDVQHQESQVAREFDWAAVQINGKRYLPLEKIKEFYRADTMRRENKTTTIEDLAWSATFTEGSHVIHINKVKFLLSEPILNKDEAHCISQLDLTTLIDPILRPRAIANAKPIKTVILDAGHGGKDKGSAGLEAGETLKLAFMIRDLLVKQGLEVILTRDANEWVSLGDRVNMANAHDSAIMLSLHYNSGNKRASGFETYVMSARVPAPNNNASIALATAVHSRCMLYLNDAKRGQNLKIIDRGIRRARFNILSGCRHPTIYIEAGFLTNKEEAAKIQTLAYRKTLAEAISRGIQVYRASLKK